MAAPAKTETPTEKNPPASLDATTTYIATILLLLSVVLTLLGEFS
jgi:hypothetical protein